MTFRLTHFSGVLVIAVAASFANPVLAQDAPSAPQPALTLHAPSAERPDTQERTPRLQWNPEWRRVHWAELASGITLGIGSLLVARTMNEPDSANWEGGVLFDDGVRNGLALQSERARQIVGTTADALLFTTMAYPVIIDAILVAAIMDRNLDVAWQLAVMDFQAMMLTAFVMGLTKRLVARERPYAQERCADPTAENCGPGERFYSFFSGHTAMAFTGAGLVCSQHRAMDLYGGGAADAAACGTALAAASLTGLFRVLGDKHWLTDVVLGAAVGLTVGWLMPRFLHFREPREQRRGIVMPYASPNELGLTYQRNL